ncbi:hypothetical protein [Shimia sp. MMG029]|uniref:hypothetical protein n=1 Tax=Shimia sp. MMG029 TaxID=3021978 RepID=UPI0022FDE1F5|nr:hypothetical protein [Shimia sp. MMG029]MDA5555145.1 hypothetical protein [Shimia sp. MMG029]
MAEHDFQLLELLIERGSYMNTYWNFFIGVSSALVGILASGKNFTKNATLKVVLVLVFIVFAASNFEAISSLVQQRHALLAQLSPNFPADLKASLQPKSFAEYLTFHLVLDVLVVVCILFVPWHRLHSE